MKRRKFFIGPILYLLPAADNRKSYEIRNKGIMRFVVKR